MAASFSKGIGTAIKRARSQDSLRSSETPHSAKADEAEEPPDDFGIPAYLRQSRAGKYPKVIGGVGELATRAYAPDSD